MKPLTFERERDKVGGGKKRRRRRRSRRRTKLDKGQKKLRIFLFSRQTPPVEGTIPIKARGKKKLYYSATFFVGGEGGADSYEWW